VLCYALAHTAGCGRQDADILRVVCYIVCYIVCACLWSIRYCDLDTSHSETIPSQFQYFADPGWGGYYSSPDFCPFFWAGSSWHECFDTSDAPASNTMGEVCVSACVGLLCRMCRVRRHSVV